jgi:predicted CxxxxCH...CXXCH cytochrome family protein
MKTKFYFPLSVAALAATLLISCSDIKNDIIPPVPSVKVHPEGFPTATSPDFHGTMLKAQNYDLSACKKCHGGLFTGGTSGKSCYSCHSAYPHLSVFSDSTASSGFHGKVLQANSYDMSQCKLCHGASFTGGSSGVACSTCHSVYPHTTSFVQTTTAQDFHGVVLQKLSWNKTACTPCHGTQFTGGTSGKSCFTCHSAYPHPTMYSDSSATTGFHGKILKASAYDMTQCKLCHGDKFDGGNSNVKCSQCHDPYPHTSGFEQTIAAADFHGTYLKNLNWSKATCAPCHGTQFTGGTSGKSCYTCHNSYPHTAGVSTVSATDFHGKTLKSQSWNLTPCKDCHGTTYAGGRTNSSCYTCHSTYPHDPVFTPAGGHSPFLRTNSYPLSQCQSCHGSTYTGGAIANVSCSSSGCHVTSTGVAKSPESCNTCHGSFAATANDTLSFAPPKSILGDSLSSVRGVGAHRIHLAGTGATSSTPVQCDGCHSVPTTVFSAGHLGSAPAEVVINAPLAKIASGGIVPAPTYDSQTLHCSGTYCHGNWRLRKSTSTNPSFYTDSIMVGANYSVQWNGGAAEKACGTCHGLPPTGHTNFALSACVNCHSGVVDNTGTIIDKAKHLNGKINVFGTEKAMQ